ncbi:MAG: methyltransferase domain-containing protein [Thermoguttaceae bacterium]|nr:methyltransferase domain-containing protein [Thermoguttaceae bacterium]
MNQDVNPARVRLRFERSFTTYEKYAALQKGMAKRLMACVVEHGTDYPTIFEAGVGTGFLTAEALRFLRFDHYLTNDIVPCAANVVHTMIPASQFLEGDLCGITLPSQVDLVLAGAVFQWLRLEEIFRRCAGWIRPGGLLAFSTFQPGHFAELRDVGGLSLSYSDQETIQAELAQNGFQCIRMEAWSETLYFNTPMDVLRYLKATGVNSVSPRPWTLREVRQFSDAFQQRYPSARLTCRPLLVLAVANTFDTLCS